ncbi:Crp/Fnr family transcriptional regulator [Selenihalanaerobacter shriftii]|uniref:CRP/FNR family transcriptional regulator, anaerobic regulatory protein n=1 Tax=Selenihalanaerobacter shriftii TaxID=142842 RepID=A0A1T4M7H2_9FIRM|nr:Crp/Fnr family transcriptional regulator [Selenihalanaerobacter shriftii]SJZ62851.1 CRP/FNR family transcriptional regulator, anaerobic regulatory protein [Selenihalanaerobacter shriftii]
MDCCQKNELCASKVPIFTELSLDKLEEVNKLVNRKEYKKGEIIFLQGQLGKKIYILNSGQAKIYKTSRDGKEHILRLLKENDFFGEMVLFKEDSLDTSAQAITDCIICEINKKDLERLLKENSNIVYRLLSAITSRLKEAEQMLESLALEDARQKTIRLLVDLAQESGVETKEGLVIELPLSREGLANLLAMTQETLSRKLSNLQTEGIITIHGQKKVIIRKKELLKNS